jgi:hypothetical protein
LTIAAARYRIVPLFIRELVVGGWAGALLIGPLLIGPWLIPRTGFVPVLRIRLPLPSLAFEMLYCASAEVAHANTQKIANTNLMCPRFHSGFHTSSGCPEMHSQTGGIGRP